MQLLSSLLRDERTLKVIFGIGKDKFDELAVGMERLWHKHLESKPDRERAVGGGQHGKIPTGRQKVAFILFYLKVYPTFDVMPVFSAINRGDCRRWVHALLPLLEQLLGQKLALPREKSTRWRSFCRHFRKQGR